MNLNLSTLGDVLTVTHCRFERFVMNKISRVGLVAALSTMGASAFAAVPANVTDALTALQTDALTVAGVVLAAIVAVYAFKFIRKGL